MKAIVLAAVGVVVVAVSSSAAVGRQGVTNTVNITKLSREERAKLKEVFANYEGGRLGRPGTKQGKIVYVNAQKRASVDLIKAQIAEINKHLNYDIEVVEGVFALPSPEVKGEATLFVVDEPTYPSLLAAPENRWVMVNVAGLAAGEGEKPQFFEARVRKELTRGFCLLAGAQDSSFKMSLMGCKTKPEQLDSHIDCRLPVDVIKRFGPYLEGYGIKPEKIVSYRKACEEGWAPKPTNDVQKAVWEDVHTIPDEPLKIKYQKPDQATDAGK